MFCLNSYLGHELLFPWFAYPRRAKSVDRWRIFRKDVKIRKARPGTRRGRWTLTISRFHYAALASSGCENSIDRTGHRTDTRPRWALALALWCAGSCVSTMARTSSMRSCTLDRDPALRPQALDSPNARAPSQQCTPPGAPPGLKPSGLKVS